MLRDMLGLALSKDPDALIMVTGNSRPAFPFAVTHFPFQKPHAENILCRSRRVLTYGTVVSTRTYVSIEKNPEHKHKQQVLVIPSVPILM
jgi:hypothetical protein